MEKKNRKIENTEKNTESVRGAGRMRDPESIRGAKSLRGAGSMSGFGGMRGSGGMRSTGAVGSDKLEKGTWGKLLRYCKKHWGVMIIAVIFAAGGTVLTLAGPDKLSEMTDVIADGLAPDTEMLGKISAEIMQNGAENKQEEIEVDQVTISVQDQKDMMSLLSGMDQTDPSAALEVLDELPESVYSLVKPEIDMKKILSIGGLLAALYGIGVILSALQGWIMATVTQKISRQLRSDISEKINRLPMSYFHHHSTGDVLSRVTNDVDMIGTSLNMSVGTMVSAITLFFGSLIMMVKTNLIMTLTGVLATILGFVLMMVIMGRSQKYFTRQQKNLGDINGQIEEIYSGHTVVKAYNGEEKAKKEFDELNGKLKDSGYKAQAMSGLMMPIMTFIGNFGYVAVCVVGAALALDGKISFGVIVSFMLYIRFFTQPLSQMAQAAQQLQSAGAASSRVFNFIEEEEMEEECRKTGTLTNTQGNVTFSHVGFGYEPEQTIIHDFSADVKAGQKIAIVGPTGAGKTTIVNLLMRFYEINSGKICIDGVDTSTLNRGEIHSQFCMVLQDTWLFEGTVKENLIYCSQNQSEEKMKSACKAVGLDHFIRTLPKGYDTVLNDQVSLSQGQKQQLTIARAMIADKPILILDEATSSIDTRTEQQIQKAMDELMKGRTSFVIAHRLSTIKNADLILVLKDGDVIESGTHEELIAQKGFYEDLYNSQFDKAS
ncbi:MAG: ABC transporter ATP-binding protein [Lachnospiraceae bacterium]|nr:ABC transporter ATP-binding protein [Lachnospiraceae bacterium]